MVRRRRQAHRRQRQCQAAHLVYVLSGRTKAVLDDGTEVEAGLSGVAYTRRARRLDCW